MVDPGGLRAFWGGFRSTDSSDPQRETNTALSPDGGATLALQPGQVVPDGAQSYGSNTAATVGPGGTTLQAFAGTLGMQVGMLGRTPLAARAGGGFYVAYPTGYPASNRIRVWRIGASNAPLIARVAGSGSPAVAIAAAGDGRLWILWTRGFGDPDVLARRSNQGATRFGAVVNAGHPKDAAQAYKLDASAAGGAVDVLGNFNIGTTSTAVTSYRRILPGLTLRARPGKVRRGRPTDVHFTVLDAGTAVRGARVRAAGESGTTDAKGRVTLSVTSRRAVTARGTHAGYAAATKRLAVRR